MSLLLNDAATEYLRTPETPLGAGSIYPFSVSVIYNTDDAVVADQTFFCISDLASNIDFMRVARSGSGTGNPNEVYVYITSTENGAKSAYSDVGDTGANVWNQAGCVCASTTSAYAYLNGVPGAISAVDVETDNLGDTALGSLLINAGNFAHLSGKMAEVGVWNAALTTAEMAILAEFVSPMFVRPESLVQYYQLRHSWGSDVSGDYGNLFSQKSFTGNSDGTNAAHPNIIYPSGSVIAPKTTITGLITGGYRRPMFIGIGKGVYR